MPEARERILHRLRRSVRGLRGRVVLSYVLLVAGALLVTLLVVRQVLIVRADARIESALVQEVDELDRLAEDGVDPETGEPFGTDAGAILSTFLARNVPADNEYFLTFVDGQPHLETVGTPPELRSDREVVRRWASLEDPLRADVGEGETEARTLAVPLRTPDGATSGVFVVAMFPAPELAEVDQAIRTIAGVGLLVVALAAVVAMYLAGRVLQPVTELTRTSRRVSDNDLTARFASEGDDEVAELGAAFNDMLDRLESGFETQRNVLDDVAHELRTPLTVVRGHLELLGDDPEERSASVELCTAELDRMGRYVDELLLVAKSQRPDFLRPAALDVGEFASDVFRRLPSMGERDWVTACSVAPGEVLVEADEDRVTQAVVNLLVNAVQHSEDGSRIEVSVVADPEEVRIVVRDHGPGIAEDVRGRLFTRFARAAGSRTHRPEGTGLGLAIVAAVAEAHGGTVSVDDPPGGGARFTLALPRHLADADDEELP